MNSDAPTPAPPGVLLQSAFFGLVTGLFELGLLVARVEVWGNGKYARSSHFPWIIPASCAAILVAVGGLLAIGTDRKPGWRAWTALRLFWTFLVVDLLLTIPGLRAPAALVVGLGVACWAAPACASRPRTFRAIVRRGTPLLAVVVLILVGVCVYREAGAERRALEKLPPAAPGAPNVVLIVLDTVRADHLGLYGYGRDNSPNLTRLARRGTTFEHARSTASWTLPSHASMFTGRWPHELSVADQGSLDCERPTLAEFLGANGYTTAGFVANLFFCGRDTGLARGFAHYEDYVVTPAAVLRSSALGWYLIQRAALLRERVVGRLGAAALDFQRKDAAEINRDFLRWLDRRGDRPFFAFLNYFDAHDPYIPPDGYRWRYGPGPRGKSDRDLLKDWQTRDKRTISRRDTELARDAYDTCIAYLDEQLGRLFEEMDRRQLLHDTIVLITSDHGEQFGEHGSYGHGLSLYDSEIRVPLILIAPSLSSGRVVSESVSLRDVAATVADLARVRTDSPFPGRSMARVGFSEDGPAEPSLSELGARIVGPANQLGPPIPRGPLDALITGPRVYIRDGRGGEELYDVGRDPGEARNLSPLPESQTILPELRHTLERLRGPAGAKPR